MADVIGEAVLKLRVDDDFDSGLDSAHRKAESGMQKTAQKMGSVGKKMSLAFTAPIVAGLGAAVSKFSTFDSSIRQVGAIAGISGRQLESMKNLAMDMGAQTAFSAQEAADAMLELSKGGMTAAQQKAGVLKNTLTLAAAGGLELGASATYMSNAMNMFGLKARNSGAIAAAFAGAANASTASVESLGTALSQVGPGAKQAGMTLQETVGALAAFDQAGVKGSDAGTSLKVMLQSLVPQTNTARDAMKRLGLDFTNADGSFLSMSQVAQQLQDKMKGLSAEQKTTALATIFGADASRAAGILMETGAKGIDKYAKAAGDLGAAQKLAKVNTSGLSGAIERMKGTLETVAIQLGEQLGPYAERAAGFVEMLGNKFMALSPRTKMIVLAVLGLVAAIGLLLVGVGLMLPALSAIGAVLGAISAPVVLVVAGVIAVGLALAYLWKTSATFRQIVITNFNALQAGVMKVFNELKKTIAVWGKWARQFWKTHGAAIMATVMGAFKRILQIVRPLLSVLRNVVTAALRLLRGDWRGAWNAIKAVLVAAWTFIKATVRNAGHALKVIGRVVAKGLVTALKAGWSGLKSLGSWAWEKLKSGLSKLPGLMLGLAKKIGSALVDGLKLEFKLPKVSLKKGYKDFLGKKVPVPKFSIKWLAQGGVMRRPTLFGGGEAGPEAIVPLDRYIVQKKTQDDAGQAGGMSKNEKSVVVKQYFTGEPDQFAASRAARFAFKTARFA